MDYPVVSRAAIRFEDKMKKDNRMRTKLDSVLELLKN